MFNNEVSYKLIAKILPWIGCCHLDHSPPGPVVGSCCQDNPAAECCNNQHGECCHNNEPTECCPPNIDCCRGPLPPGWIELPIRLTQIDSGLTPSVWGMNGKHSLYMLGSDNNMIPVDGTMHHVSAGQAGVWAVGLLGNVFFRRGVSVANEKGKVWMALNVLFLTDFLAYLLKKCIHQVLPSLNWIEKSYLWNMLEFPCENFVLKSFTKFPMPPSWKFKTSWDIVDCISWNSM